MTPEPDLLREERRKLDELMVRANRGIGYLSSHGGPSGQTLREVAEVYDEVLRAYDALATRLSAAHQPAENKVVVVENLSDPSWRVEVNGFEVYWAANRETAWTWAERFEAVLALPPPAPGLDPEAVARVIGSWPMHEDDPMNLDQIARARGWYATLETGVASLIDPKLVGALLRRIDSLEAAHQPAAPAWGLSREQIADALARSYGVDPEDFAPLAVMCTADNQPVIWREVYLEQADAILALPPPAPTLDLEAVARVIEELDAEALKQKRAAESAKTSDETQRRNGKGFAYADAAERLRALAKARAIIAMAPSADASQSADITIEGDGRVIEMARILHSHLPEDERPMARMDFSDDQWARMSAAFEFASQSAETEGG